MELDPVHVSPFSEPYIAAEFETVSTLLFPIGDGKSIGGYINKRLQEGKLYEVFLRAEMKSNFFSFTASEHQTEFPIGRTSGSPQRLTLRPALNHRPDRRRDLHCCAVYHAQEKKDGEPSATGQVHCRNEKNGLPIPRYVQPPADPDLRV